MNDTLNRGVSDHAVKIPDKPALIFNDESRTFRELDDRTNSLGLAVRSLGLLEGDSIAIMLPNGIEWFEVSTMADKVHAAIVPVNWHLKRDEIAYILDDSNAKLIIAHADFEDQVRAALENMHGRKLLLVGSDGPDSYEAAIASSASDAVKIVTTGYPHVVYYTSGTSGRPKGVSHDAFDFTKPLSNGIGQVQLWWWSEHDINICNGPAYHAGPFAYTSVALLIGATSVILERFDAHGWLNAVDRYRVTRGFMVPGHFVRILEVPAQERAEYDLSSLELIVHAAAPCPIRVKQEMMELLPNCQIWELYGASEGGATRIGPDDWKRKLGSVGLPWPGVGIAIRDDKGNEVLTGEKGIVYITPPTGSSKFAYRNDDEKTGEAWIGDSFTVGDMGYLDEDGYLFLSDRISDMIIRGGVNIYPREIEETLLKHPAVVDCVVFGVPDPRFNELIKAMVEVRTPTDPEELLEWCRSRIADFKVPHFLEIVPELPRTPTGKILKRYLRDQHWADQPSSVNTA